MKDMEVEVNSKWILTTLLIRKKNLELTTIKKECYIDL
jgi:hypothetical protein